jgi:hypothetical protein
MTTSAAQGRRHPSTLYLANAVLDQLGTAQVELDQHVVTGLNGRCTACDELEPCFTRRTISTLFASYQRLPSRRPGLAGGHFICGRRIA